MDRSWLWNYVSSLQYVTLGGAAFKLGFSSDYLFIIIKSLLC